MKYLTSTYLKDVEKYKLSLFYEKNYCIVVKKIIKIKAPFILREENKDIVIVDNDYYILEYMPFNRNYICRIHIDKTQKIIEWFYLATKNNSIVNGIPVFEDLKLSCVIVNKTNIYKLYNEDLAKNILSTNDYQLALKEINSVNKEVKNKTNFIFNMEYKKYLI